MSYAGASPAEQKGIGILAPKHDFWLLNLLTKDGLGVIVQTVIVATDDITVWVAPGNQVNLQQDVACCLYSLLRVLFEVPK